jgi:prepilin-type processing-associated H-X9-DG protein
VTAGFYHAGTINVQFVDGHGESIEGSPREASADDDGPAGVNLDPGMTVYSSLSLPPAIDRPDFWGPPYDRTD